MKKTEKKVEIEWVDSKGGDIGWEHREGLYSLTPAKCTTLGFLLEDTKEYKTVAQTVSSTQVLSRITIPSNCIKRMKILG